MTPGSDWLKDLHDKINKKEFKTIPILTVGSLIDLHVPDSHAHLEHSKKNYST
jgi:hypothetical protein